MYRPALLVLVGCAEPTGASFVAPFDGATSIAVDASLLVETAWLGLPAGYPVDPSTVTVVELPDGEPVAGTLDASSEAITFLPAVPWTLDGDYRWDVAAVDAVPRQIRPDLPAGVLGGATFSLSDRPLLLDAVLDTGVLCLVFSQPVPDDELLVGVSGRDAVPVGATAIDPLEGIALPPDLPGAPGAACLDVSFGTLPGDTLTWISASGVPSAVVVALGSVDLAVRARFRWTAP